MSESDLRAENFSIIWSVQYAKNGEEDSRYTIQLVNNGEIPLEGNRWALYFNFSYGFIPEKASPNVVATHINGDLYQIRPSGLFQSLPPGESMLISLNSRSLAFKESDAPTGFYIIFSLDQSSQPDPITDVRIEPEIEAKQTRRGEDDHVAVPTPASRYRDNQSVTQIPYDQLIPIIPSPVRYKKGTGEWSLDATVRLFHESGLESEADFLIDALEKRFGLHLKTATGPDSRRNGIHLKIAGITVDAVERGNGDEAYHLSISENGGVRITGSDGAGLFYGIQSLLALLPTTAMNNSRTPVSIPEIEVYDVPRFPYRGFMLDVSRNFQSKESILKLLDLMAFYKLNKFHFHLADDEGWRLEIKSLPELTEVGGRRGHSVDEQDRLLPSFGSGPNPPEAKTYYTRRILSR